MRCSIYETPIELATAQGQENRHLEFVFSKFVLFERVCEPKPHAYLKPTVICQPTTVRVPNLPQDPSLRRQSRRTAAENLLPVGNMAGRRPALTMTLLPATMRYAQAAAVTWNQSTIADNVWRSLRRERTRSLER